MSRVLLFLGSALASMGAMALLHQGLKMVINEEESHRVRWFPAECRILSSGWEDTFIACSDDCGQVKECNGQKVEDGCAAPCCGFKWWYAYWTVSSQSFRNGDRYSAYHCSHHQRSFFAGSQASRFCNSTVLETDARAVSRSKAVGSMVPCWVDEFQTDLKMSDDDEVKDSNTFLGMLYVVIGFAPVWCCLLSAVTVLAQRFCIGAGPGVLQKRRDMQLLVEEEDPETFQSSHTSALEVESDTEVGGSKLSVVSQSRGESETTSESMSRVASRASR
eukprot:gnl/MRDRNA2_/MRDRNA2_144984_c0_seq1.p1 gnl/MRDRNA2_/MRDRNA2_144984_c0~~gnl/MRDRNA2_/MRDRNA2_144984_c0_seq1.p1  ORF type:complete len:276 (-),score=31.88 gnl/MRDRNA2_/MRDRNA2_144984_c0_seq1:96-923(-)